MARLYNYDRKNAREKNYTRDFINAMRTIYTQ